MLTPEIEARIISYFKEDLGSGDISSEITPPKECTAVIKANEPCTLAGLEETLFLVHYLGLKARAIKKDGEAVKRGQAIVELHGSNRKILTAERICLNILGRMSGVATLCTKAKKICEMAGKKTGQKPMISVTRKTMPGFQLLDKKAAEASGCWTHRKNLAEMILLKDNHLKFFKSTYEACMQAKATGKKYEIEATTEAQATEAAKAQPDIIMLDNFQAHDAKKAMAKLRKKGFAGQIEISGGITLANLKNYCGLGADIISMGELTKKARIIDFNMDILKVKK